MDIGLLGGTFDPVHNGHLALARTAFDALHLEKVVFIPAFIPPHKESKSIMSVSHRLRMLELSLLENPFCEISDIEIKKNKKVFTIDTLQELKRNYPRDVRLFFLVGSDFIHEYHTWKEPAELLELATFIIASRPGFSYTILPQGMQVLEGNFPDISSTDIRDKLKKREDVSDLLPPNVLSYIKKHALYR